MSNEYNKNSFDELELLMESLGETDAVEHNEFDLEENFVEALEAIQLQGDIEAAEIEGMYDTMALESILWDDADRLEMAIESELGFDIFDDLFDDGDAE